MRRAARTTTAVVAVGVLAVAGCGEESAGDESVEEQDLSTTVVAGSEEEAGADDTTTGPDDTAPGLSAVEVTGDVAASGEYADFWQAIDDGGTDIQGALVFDANPIADVQVPIDMYLVTEAALEDIVAAVPTGVPATAEAPLEAFVAYVEAWLETATETRTQLEAERDDLQAANDEYLASEVDGPPPLAYTDLIDRNFEAAEGFGTVCVEMATELDIGPDCFRMLADGGAPDGAAGGVEDVGVVGIELGELSGEVDVGPALDTLIEPGFVGIDLGPAATITITEPPDVADPDDLGEGIRSPMPWPDDVSSWLGQLPVDVVETTTVELSGSEFERSTFQRSGTEAVAVIANPYWPDGGGAYVLRGEETVVVWDGAIDGQPVVGVLWSADPRADVGPFLERSEEILASISAS